MVRSQKVAAESSRFDDSYHVPICQVWHLAKTLGVHKKALQGLPETS